jgi:hypothetical protein
MDNIKTNIKERVLQIAKSKGLSYEFFFNDLGISYSNFKGKQKNTSLQSDSIDKIITKYTDIDLHWLITGQKKYGENDAQIKFLSHQLSQFIRPSIMNVPKIT